MVTIESMEKGIYVEGIAVLVQWVVYSGWKVCGECTNAVELVWLVERKLEKRGERGSVNLHGLSGCSGH